MQQQPYASAPMSPMAQAAYNTMEMSRGGYQPNSTGGGFRQDRFDHGPRYLKTTKEPTQWHNTADASLGKVHKTLEKARLKPREEDARTLKHYNSRGGSRPGALSYTKPHFRNGLPFDPKVEIKPANDLPSDISDRLAEGKLMSSGMRRRAMQAERDMQLARKELRRRQFEVDRRVGYMKRHHKDGVLNFDTPGQNQTHLYNEEQSKMYKDFMVRSKRKNHRASNIIFNDQKYEFKGDLAVSHGGTRTRHNPMMANHDPVSRREKPFLQQKTHSGPKLDTHGRVFGPVPIRTQDARKERIRNLQTRGRNFDIISGVKVEAEVPTIGSKDRRFKHINGCYSDDLPAIYPH